MIFHYMPSATLSDLQDSADVSKNLHFLETTMSCELGQEGKNDYKHAPCEGLRGQRKPDRVCG